MRLLAKTVVALSMVSAGVALAQAKPNFSGTWIPVSEPKEGAQGVELHIRHDATSITIGHPEGDHGPNHSQRFSLDGRPAQHANLAHPSETDMTQATWDGDRLVLVVRPSEGGPQHKRVLSLQPDGMLLMEVTLTIAGRPEETLKATFRKK
jgi:hypothetical protein